MALGNGQTTRYDFNKITGASAYALGRWYDMSSLGGLPIANAGRHRVDVEDRDESTGNGTQIFGAAWRQYVARARAPALHERMGHGSNGRPGTLTAWSICRGYWPGISNNTTSVQTLLGTPTLRYTNGAGCRPVLADRWLALRRRTPPAATPISRQHRQHAASHRGDDRLGHCQACPNRHGSQQLWPSAANFRRFRRRRTSPPSP